MFRSHFLLNIILLVIIIVLGVKLYNALFHTVDIPTQAIVQDGQYGRITVTRKVRAPDKSSIHVITSKDIFRDTRSSSQTTERQRKPIDMKNLPTLFGTIIMNGQRKAIIKMKGEKSNRILEQDATIAGFQISEIQEDKVVLIQDGEKIELKLRNKKSVTSKPAAEQKRQPRKRRVRPRPVSKETSQKDNPPDAGTKAGADEEE